MTGASRVTIALKRKNEDLLGLLRGDAEKEGYELSSCTRTSIRPGDEYVPGLRDHRPADSSRRTAAACRLRGGQRGDRSSTSARPSTAARSPTSTSRLRAPWRHRMTTVVPVGTSFADCLKAAGGCTIDDPTFLVSGVMMGGVSRDRRRSDLQDDGRPDCPPIGPLSGASQDGNPRNLHADRPRPVRPVFALHRAVPPLHPGLSHRTASRHADVVDDRRGEGAWQPVGPVLLRVQHLLLDRLSGIAGPEEYLRGCQGIAAREQAGAHRSGTGTALPATAPRTSRPGDPDHHALSAPRTDPLRSQGAVCRTRLGTSRR